MVKYGEAALDRTFAALADPTRRALLARLAAGEASVSALAAPFAMSLPAVMKHLAVLGDAGLVVRRKAGRSVTCRLAAAPLEDAAAWLARYQRFWTAQLDRLAALLEDDTWRQQPPRRRGRASPSRAASRRRRRRSSAPGSTPKS